MAQVSDKKHYPTSKASVEQFKKALKNLHKKGKRTLTPEEVVREAEDPKSPLHVFFEWDDTEAARMYRVHQARQFICRIRVEITMKGDLVPTKLPAYLRDTEVGISQGVIAIDAVLDDGKRSRDVLDRELERLEGYLARVNDLARAMGADREFLALVAKWASGAGAALHAGDETD